MMPIAERLQIVGILHQLEIPPMRDDVIDLIPEHPLPLEETLHADTDCPEVRLPEPAPRPPVPAHGKPIRDRSSAPPMRQASAPGDQFGTVRLETMTQGSGRHHKKIRLSVRSDPYRGIPRRAGAEARTIQTLNAPYGGPSR